MSLRVVGAGLPRTGTTSLKVALGQLLGGRCHHMSVIPGHPFDLGEDWQRALAGETPDWERLLGGFVAAVDWPAALFWRELAEANPGALVLHSVRDDLEAWLDSFEEMVVSYARLALASDWKEGRALVTLLERFTGTRRWDERAAWRAARERHDEAVRRSVPAHRRLEWRATEGWKPICHALGLPVPDLPFPHRDGRGRKD